MIDIEGMRKAVSKAFLNAYGDSRQIQAALKKVENGLANYAGITDYSVQTGQLLSKVLLDAINEECLENGYLLKDVADGVVDPSIMKAYEEVAGTASQVQANINQETGLSFNALEGQIDRSRVTNLTAKLVVDEFEKTKWLLNPDVLENITRSAVTDTLKENASFHKEAGIHPYLRRYSRGKCCEWCDKMQGAYEYGEQPDDFWRIHKHCTCVIEYKPSKYKRTDIISYVTGDDGKMRKVTEQKRIEPKDVTEEYLKNATPGVGKILYDDGYDKAAHKNEIAFAQWVHDTLGGDIALLTEGNRDHEKTPDYLWRHKYWDMKNSSSEKSANSAIRHGLQQIRLNPGGIMLDFGRMEFSMSKLQNVIGKRMQWNKLSESVDIMIISNGALKKVLRY